MREVWGLDACCLGFRRALRGIGCFAAMVMTMISENPVPCDAGADNLVPQPWGLAKRGMRLVSTAT